MEISRKNFRAMIFYKYNLTPKQCIDRLHLAFGDETPSKDCLKLVCRIPAWTFLCNEFREGHPSTSVVATNVDAVRKMIERDQHITYCEIQASLGIDMSNTYDFAWSLAWAYGNFAIVGSHTIWPKLKNRLVLNGAKKCSRNSTEVDQIWSTISLLGTKHGSMDSYEPESKQQSTVGVFQNESKPTKVVCSRSAAKQMVACLFSYTGHVAIVTLEDRRTVNTD